MVSGRTADLTRCGVEGALDVECLAYTLKLAQERGANMSCEVKPVEGLIAARQQNRCCPQDSYFIKPIVHGLYFMTARWRTCMDNHFRLQLECTEPHQRMACPTFNPMSLTQVRKFTDSEYSRFCV